MELKVGDEVTTRFGEELVVLEVKQLPAKTKKGVVLEDGKTLFLAQSGEHMCWFDVAILAKEEAE